MSPIMTSAAPEKEIQEASNQVTVMAKWLRFCHLWLQDLGWIQDLR